MAPRPRRRRLLAGSALCGAALFFAFAAEAQTLPSIPLPANIAVSTGGTAPTITKPTANVLDVVLGAPRTVINWDSFHVSGADAVTFHFGQTSDIVLNKSPTAVQVDANGHVAGLVGAATGGNIWFYSPGGVLISPNAQMTAGNFVFARGVAIDDLMFANSATPLSFLRAASDSLIQIDTISLATTASISATGDLVLSASSGNLNATTAAAAGSATVSATAGSVNIGEVTAGGVASVAAPAGAITLGQLNGGGGVSAIAMTSVSVGSASAGLPGADIVLTGGTSASLGSGSAGRDIKIQGPSASLGSGNAGGDVLVTATTGDATVTGAVTAGDDIEVTATAGSVMATGATLTATGAGAADDAHVLAQSTGGSVSVGAAATQGTGATAGDVTLSGAVAATLGTGNSSHDLKVLGPSAGLGSGSAAREVLVTATSGTAMVTGAVTAGDDIEVTATAGSVAAITASLTSTGAGAVGDAHVLAQSTGGSVSVGSATTQGTGAAAGDVTVGGATTASLGTGSSSRDLKVLGPTASLGFGVASRDLFVTATTGSATVSSQAVAGDDIEVTATTGSVTAGGADLKSNGGNAVGDAHVLAQSTGGAVAVGSAETQATGGAAGDITVSGAISASLGSGASSRDLKVLGPSASLGSSSAARDIFVTATTGPATVTGVVTAGDDVEVTATAGSVAAGGASLTSTGAGAVGDAHVLAQSTGGAVSLGSATTRGTGAAAGDITVSGATTASLGSGASSHDLKVLGPGASLGSGNAADSVFVTATTGTANVTGAVNAGNDIEVTATTGSVAASSASLTATGAGASDDAHVLVKSTGGSVSVGAAATQGTGAAAGDVTIEGSTTAALSGAVSASRDVQVTAGGSVAAGGSNITAVRDVAVSSTGGDIALGSASAGDDIAIRAVAGAVTASGDLLAGQTHDAADPDPSGGADTLVGATLTGHDIDIKAQTVAVTGNVAAGRAPDAGETLGAAQVASTLVIEATNPDPSPTTAALQLATGPGKSATAHSDISLRAENAAASSIQTGDVFAGGDVAIDSAAGAITLNSALAGDDVVLRAPSGAITVTGNVEAGRDSPGMTPVDAPGAGDTLNAARPFIDFDGNLATVFSVVGFDVNISSQAIHIGGATIAGRQPSTDDPNTAGPVDTTTSDVRLETRLSLTPVMSLAPNIDLGAVIATRDMQIDSAKAITTGDLQAGRDIAVLGRGGITPGASDHSGSGVTIASAHAGDDALAFSIYGRTHILGSVSSGLPFQRLVPTNDRTIDGATEAADQLAIYLHYFDLDDASAPYVLPGSVIHISGQGVTVGGALTAHGVGSDIRILSSLDINVPGAVNAGGLASFQTQAGGGLVTVGTVNAVGDIFLDGGGTGAGVLANGALTSTSGDVAIRARDGTSISVGNVSAGDDVVVRSTGVLTLNGTVNAADGPDSVGLGDALIASDGALTLSGHAYDLTGHNIELVAGSVTTPTTLAATGDVRLQTAGAVSLSNISAGRDVLIDAGSTVLTGTLNAGRDIGVGSTGNGATVIIGNASAGDDLVLRAKGSIFATGTLSAGGGADSSASDQAGELMFNTAKTTLATALNLSGQNIDVRSSAGAIVATGAINATSDARFQTGTTTGGHITATTVTAGRDILLDGGGIGANGVLAGTLSAGGDVAVRSRDGTAVNLADITAGDDVAIRSGAGAVMIAGPVHAGGGTDSLGVADNLRNVTALTLAGHAYDLGGGANIDIVGGTIATPGLLSATGDVRLQGAGAINVVDVTAGRDVLVDSGSTVLTGVLSGGRDVAVRSTGAGASVTIGNASAGDDLVIRADGSIFATGTLRAGGGTDSAATDQAGDLMAGAQASNLNGALTLSGRTIDVLSSAGAIQVTGAVNAAGDARFQTGAGGGSITVATVTAGRDVLLDGGGAGPNGVLATGAVTATSGDVAVRARDGSAISLTDVSAGDDVVLRATGAIQTTGAVNAGGGSDSVGLGDALTATDGAVTLEGHAYDQAGHNIDIVGGSVTTTGALMAAGDVRVQSIGVLTLGDLTAGRDVLVDGASTVLTGMLTAGRDVGARSTGVGASITLGGASAGDDVVIRAQGSIFVTGPLSAGGGADSTASDQAGDLMFGAARSNLSGDLDLVGQTVDVRSAAGSILVTGSVTAGTDARFQTADGGGSVTVADVTAARDILLDGAAGAGANAAEATGLLTATSGDVAVQARDGQSIKLAGISAGDDVVLRTSGGITVNGPVGAGAGSAGDTAGLGDVLLAKDGVVTLEGQSYDLTGHDVDIVGGSVTTTGLTTAAGADSDVRVQSVGALSLGDLTAGRDVLVDGASTVLTGVLTAGRDVGARSTGAGASLTVGGAAAGDDVVLRAKGSIFVTGALSAGTGADSTAADQAGDLMFGVAKSALAGNLDLVGHMVDVRSSAGSIQVTGPTGAGTDARFQTAAGGGSVSVGAVTAGRDILLDGAAGLGSNGAQATGTLTAVSGDVAVRARGGASISLADAAAGDDIVLRSTGDIQASGTLATNGRPTTIGLGDKLIDSNEGGAITIGGTIFTLGDSDIDIMGGSIGILRTTAVGGVRIKAGGGVLGGGSAGTDILIDTDSTLSAGDLTAVGDIALRSRNGVLTTGALTAGDDIVLRAGQGITAGFLKVGGGSDHAGVGDQLFLADPTGLNGNFDMQGATIDLKSTAGSISLAGAQSPGDVRLQTTGGAVSLSSTITAGRDIFADGGSVTATGALMAARDIALDARGGSVSLATATAGNDLVVRATGDVTASGELRAGKTAAAGGVGAQLIAAGGPATLFGETADPGVGVIDLRGGNIKLNGPVTAEGGASLRLQATGSVTLAAATADRDITIDAAGDLNAGDLSAGRDVALRSSSGGISLASATASDDIVLRAANSIAVSGSLTAGTGVDANAAGDALFGLSPTSLGGDFDLVGGNIDLKSTAGGISVLGTVTAPVDVRLQAAGAVATTGAVTAGRDLLLDGGSVASSGDLRAARDIAVRAQTDSVSLANVTAGDDIVLRAARDVTVSRSVSAGGSADADGAGDRLFATDKTALNGDFDLAGGNLDVRSHGAIAITGAATAAGDARFQSVGGGAVSLGAVTAGGDLLADGGSVQASGTLLAGRDVAVRGATGAVRLASIKAGDDIAIRAGGDVGVSGTLSSGSAASATGVADRLISSVESGPIMRLVDPLAATASIEGFSLANGDIDIKSGGAISLGGDVNAAGAMSGLHLQAAGRISAGAVTVGDAIFARGGDFALGGAWRASTVRLEVTASGGLALGDDVSAPASGAALSSSAIGLIDAPTLQIFLGDSSGTQRGSALSIGTLNIDTSKIKTSFELYAGAKAQVTISGAFAPSGSGVNSTAVRIGAPNADVGDWTPGSIRVIANNGGSIGVSTTTSGRSFSDVRAFGAVELNATNDILIGYQDFIDKLSTTPAASVAQAVRALVAPQVNGGPRMLVTAGTLTLRANGKVAQQDTEGLLGSTPVGLYLFGGSATAPQLVLGRTTSKSVGAVNLPDYIELNGAITTGSAILTGSNASLANVIAFANGVTSSPYYRLNSCAILQPGSCSSSNVRTSVNISPDSLTGLTVQDRTAQAGTADPTVASATNEESWKDPR